METLLNEYFRLYIYYLFASQPYEKIQNVVIHKKYG